MTFGSNLIIDVVTLAEESRWIIIEILFNGVHDHRWPYGDKIQDYLQEEITKHKPAAILMNFLNYRYDWGNELWGPIFVASVDLKNSKIRPCSIVAVGQTGESIKSLLVAGNAQNTLDIELFNENTRALEHVRGRLDDANA